MTRSRITRKAFNPLLRQIWVRGWRKIYTYQLRVADRVNARSGWLARRIRWPLGVGSPDRWPEVHILRFGGIGDSLMSTPALRLLKQVRPQIRIVFYTSYVEAFRDLPFLDEVRPIEDYPRPSAVWSLAKSRLVMYYTVADGYCAGASSFSTKDRSLLGGISPASSAINSAWMCVTFAPPASLTRR